jgi:hypothetical protein
MLNIKNAVQKTSHTGIAVKILQTKFDNWYGYINNKRVKDFVHLPTTSQEASARRWLEDQMEMLAQVGM